MKKRRLITFLALILISVGSFAQAYEFTANRLYIQESLEFDTLIPSEQIIYIHPDVGMVIDYVRKEDKVIAFKDELAPYNGEAKQEGITRFFTNGFDVDDMEEMYVLIMHNTKTDEWGVCLFPEGGGTIQWYGTMKQKFLEKKKINKIVT